jgi:hypothetical protein
MGTQKPSRSIYGLRNQIHLPGHVDGHIGHAAEGPVRDGLGAELAVRDEGAPPIVREALACLGLGLVGCSEHVAGPARTR